MDKVKLIANAKVNLSIDVLQKLESGYHELDMIIQEVDISDTVSLEKRSDDQIKIYSNWNLPNDSDNIAYRAAQYINDTYGIKTGYDIKIDKQIPIESGLAGGSSDGAGVIKAIMLLEKFDYIPVEGERIKLDWRKSEVILPKKISEKEHFEKEHSKKEDELFINSFDLYDMCENDHRSKNADLFQRFSLDIARKIGCDVSFFTRGKTMRVRGIGDLLSAIDNQLEYYFVIIKPDLNILTKWVYSNLELEQISKRPNNDEIEKALKSKDFNHMTANMHNVLEEVVSSKYPIIEQIKRELMEYNAEISMMSGSGSSVFGVFKEYQSACSAYEKLSSHYQNIYICKGF